MSPFVFERWMTCVVESADDFIACSMLCVYVRGEELLTGNRSLAKLSLIDLAGYVFL